MYEIAEIDTEKIMPSEDKKVAAASEEESLQTAGDDARVVEDTSNETSNAATFPAVVEDTTTKESTEEKMIEEESASSPISQDNKKQHQVKQRHYKLFNRFGKRKINVSSSKKPKNNEEEEESKDESSEENSLLVIAETSKEDIVGVNGDEGEQTPPPLPPKVNRFQWKRSGIPVKVSATPSSNVQEEEKAVIPDEDVVAEDVGDERIVESKALEKDGQFEECQPEQHVESEASQTDNNEIAPVKETGGKRKFSRKIPRSIRMKRKSNEVPADVADVDGDVKPATEREPSVEQQSVKQRSEKRKKFHWKRFSLLSMSKESEELLDQEEKADGIEISKDEKSEIDNENIKLLISGEEGDATEPNTLVGNAEHEETISKENDDSEAFSPNHSNDVDDTLEASSLTHVTQMLEKEEESTEKTGVPFLSDDGPSSSSRQFPDELSRAGECNQDVVESKEEDTLNSSEDTVKSDKVTDFVLVDPYTEKPKDDSFYLTKKALKVYQKAHLSQNYCQACCTMM